NVPLQCSDDTLKITGELSEQEQITVHTHLAESRTETVSSQVRFNGAFIEKLIDFGVLGERGNAAHSVWVGDRDLRRLADSRTTLVHCPSSNLRLGAGIAQVSKWVSSGLEWALGSDGAASSDSLNMVETLKY